MSAPGSVNPDGYVHARTEQEYQRLKAQARLWEEATARALALAGLGPGMSCLDVGCGPGEVMRLMAGMVGAKGRVVGVDIDGAIGARALAELEAAGTSRFGFVAADALRLDTVPGAPFDLAFTRLTLMHLDRPVEMLARMKDWVKPGGIVLAQEYDFGSLDVEPRFAGWTEFETVFHGVFEAGRRDMRAGRHLPAQFAAAGMPGRQVCDAAARFVPIAAVEPMLAAVYDGLLPAALKLGLTDEGRAVRFRGDLERAARDGAWCMMPVLVAVRARAT